MEISLEELRDIIEDLTKSNEQLRDQLQFKDKQIETKDKLLDSYRERDAHEKDAKR